MVYLKSDTADVYIRECGCFFSDQHFVGLLYARRLHADEKTVRFISNNPVAHTNQR